MEPRQGKEDKNCQFDIGDRMVGLMTGAYYGIDTGDVNDFKSMDDVLTAFEKQLTYLISEYRCGFETDFLIEKAVCKNMMRIEDCFLKGTVENAESWIIGGTKYHKIIAQGAGLATIVDSLYAIDKLVFQEKKIKLKEFTQILANNFEGHENLALDLRKKLDKFGNDIEDVDKYAKFVVQSFVNSININNGTQYVYQMFPSLHTDRDFTTMGLYVGATPDGRRMKEPISENQSPVQGMDISGLTALLNSISKIPFKRITGGPLNIRIHPGTIKEDEGLENLRALLETYMQKGGMQVQINVVDVNTLRKAQNDPERYRNLCVRVTGYSAFFVEMGQKAQEELISRTEHLIG
jgi:formate C-acetyltransferase